MGFDLGPLFKKLGVSGTGLTGTETGAKTDA